MHHVPELGMSDLTLVEEGGVCNHLEQTALPHSEFYRELKMLSKTKIRFRTASQ